MSLDKAILHGKEHRKPYTGCKAVDMTCRNHGSDLWCQSNRTFGRRDKHPVHAIFAFPENRCVCCGAVIPEGLLVCPTCEIT